MIEIEKDTRFLFCNSCQNQDNSVITFKFHLDNQTSGTAIMLCKKCRKELKEKLEHIEHFGLESEVE